MSRRAPQARPFQLLESILQDVRYSVRTLRKSPGFAIVAVLTIALGIGANVAVFSILDGVLLTPLPYPHSQQLVSVEVSPLALDKSARGLAPEDYFIFREQSRTFEDIGVYAETGTDRDVNVTGFDEPERVHALHATGSVLAVLGIRPVLGRTFSRADDSPGAPLTAILSYGYWARKFNSNPAAIGKTILVDGRQRQIIGVLPPQFRFLDAQDFALILPLQLERNKIYLGNFSYYGIARLKPGVTLNEASADVARMLPAALETFPPPPGVSLDFFKSARIAPSLSSLKQDVTGNIAPLLWVVMTSIGLVLPIACANVANLLLVRADGRRHELALRAALGAGRRRIAVLLSCESTILGVLGGACGLLLAWTALDWLTALAPAGLPRIRDIGINLSVLLFALAITMLTTLLSGVIPILKHARSTPLGMENRRTASDSRERHRARNVLVTMQVALALLLLICSGLMIRTFSALTRVHPGFVRPAELQTFRISFPFSAASDETRVVRTEQQIQEKLAAIPGVSSVAFSSAVPLDGDNMLDNVYASDRTYTAGEIPPLRHLLFVSPGYLRTLGIQIIAGRDISWSDTYNKVPVALISENFAREYWRTPAAAIGKRIRIFSVDDWRQIIGVAADVHDAGIDKPARTTVYWPALVANFQGQRMHVTRFVTFTVRSPLAGSEAFINQIREAVWSVDGDLPLAAIRSLKSLYAKSIARTSFTLLMLGIAAAMALLLGSIGLYGVIAYTVSQRTREIGIRMALGSPQGDVMRLVLSEGMLVVFIGLGVGCAVSLGSTRLMSTLLFGVTATDPLTFATVVVLLGFIALVACYVPARRALRVDPLVALRYE